MKLNLGCGRRVLEGWTNVDVKTRGVEPDVDADIRELPFDDESADEIMAIHVIEHFYLWEVEGLLKEWLRVLKPKGKLILECPDIQKACYWLLSDLNEGKVRPQLSMWPLYGDPSHEDPLMCHKWGWTPETLKMKLNELGLRNVTEEPAQYHMKEVRDMRIEAIKPGEYA